MIMTIDDTNIASKVVKMKTTLQKKLEKGLCYRNCLLLVVYNFSFRESSQLKYQIKIELYGIELNSSPLLTYRMTVQEGKGKQQ